MGRIFNTTASGRVRTRVPVQSLPANAKAWEQMSFGQRFTSIIKEVPKVLYHFLPHESQKYIEEGIRGKKYTPQETLASSAKSIGQFAQQTAQVTANAVGGAALSVKQAATKKPESLNVPLLGRISSYQVQHNELVAQGFSDDEAKALVGINTYLGAMPLLKAGFESKPGRIIRSAATTTEVPVAETHAGIKAAIKGEPVTGSTTIERAIITKVKELFGKAPEQDKFHDLLQTHLENFFEGRGKLLSKEDPLNKTLLKLNDKELQSYSAVTQGLAEPIKPSLPLTEAVDLWKQVNKEIETDLIKSGKLNPEQVELRRWKPIEEISGRTKEELSQMGIEPQYYPYLAEDSLKKSDFISTTGKRTKSGYLKRFTGKLLYDDNYIKDPRVAIPRNRLQVFRDKMNSELVDSIRDTFAEHDAAIVKELKQNPKLANELGLTEWKPSGNLRFFKNEKGVGVTKNVEAYWIPETVAKELDKFYKPGILEKTLRMTYDPLIDAWRIAVLNLAPRWIYNNVMGNSIMSILGKTDPFAFLKSGKEMFIRTKVGEKVGEKLGINQREIPKGVFSDEYAKGEMPRVGSGLAGGKEPTQFLRPLDNWLNLLEQAKQYPALRVPAAATQALIRGYIALGKPGAAVNKVAENWFRGAMYISQTEGKFLGFRLDKPKPPIEGLRHVNEFLFDYSKLSRGERATFRRALPFWNWTKNITQFAFKFPYNHPTRGLVVGALLQDYVDYVNENQKGDESKSVLRIKLDTTYEGKPLYLNIKSAIPFSDVFRTLPTSFKSAGRFLTSNPVSKIILERAFGVNSYTGQPFTQPAEKIQYDDYGNEVPPLPSLPEHLAQQIPQTKIAQNIADQIRYKSVLKRYETGDIKAYRNQIQTSDLLMEIMKYFGVSISPVEYNKIKEAVDRKEQKTNRKERIYDASVNSALQRLRQTR